MADSYCTIRNEKELFCTFSLGSKLNAGNTWYGYSIVYRRSYDYDWDILKWYNKYSITKDKIEDEDDVDDTLFTQCCMWWYSRHPELGVTEC